jgi:hypothetical protein
MLNDTVGAAFAVVGVMIAHPTRMDDATAMHLRQNIRRPSSDLPGTARLPQAGPPGPVGPEQQTCCDAGGEEGVTNPADVVFIFSLFLLGFKMSGG